MESTYLTVPEVIAWFPGALEDLHELDHDGRTFDGFVAWLQDEEGDDFPPFRFDTDPQGRLECKVTGCCDWETWTKGEGWLTEEELNGET